MTPVRVRVPAKINLALRVGPCRADGFHDLATVFHAVDLFDYVTVSAAPDLTISVTQDDAWPAGDVPTDASNLAWRAAVALAARAGIVARAHIEIDKAIPVAGGMAGGSADAAAALVGLDALWELRTPPAVLTALATDLGSDVPFALRGGTAVGTGRGEHLTTVFGHGRFHWVVVPVAGEGLSTPAVYAELDRQRPTAPAPSVEALADVVAACGTGSAPELAAALCNDLEPAAVALRPSLAGVLARGRAAGAMAGSVSGSGPTCVFLAASEDHAWDVAAAFDDAIVTSGPVAGAARVS